MIVCVHSISMSNVQPSGGKDILEVFFVETASHNKKLLSLYVEIKLLENTMINKCYLYFKNDVKFNRGGSCMSILLTSLMNKHGKSIVIAGIKSDSTDV